MKTTKAANQKFEVGDLISWKGGPARVTEVHGNTPWPYYRLLCDNGTHTLEFADQSFCDLLAPALTSKEVLAQGNGAHLAQF